MMARDERHPSEEELLARVRGLARDIEPPADLWGDVAAALRPDVAPRAIPGPDRAWGFAPRFASWRVHPALAAALVVALGGALWLHVRTAGFHAEATTGRPLLGSSAITTDAASTARLVVGRIGVVDVAPNSRVRLLAGRGSERRLALDVGAIAARISAPPRLFVVETPSATAVDLGCEYTLAVDSRGASLVHVTVGWVELDGRGRTSVVPYNMSAYTPPGFAPGTPFADGADDSLKGALYRFDFERGGERALGVVLARAKAMDAITLWHLLARTQDAARAAVYRRLAMLAPPPQGVSEAGVMQLKAGHLGKWWDALPGSPGTLPWWLRFAVKISAWLGVL